MHHNSFTKRLSLRALQLSASRRRFLLITADVLLIPIAVWLSFWLRLAEPWGPQLQDCLWIFPTAWLIALPLYGFTGQYKGLTRYVGSSALYRLAGRNGLLVLLLAMTGVMLQLSLPPRSSLLLLWLLLTGLTGTVRFALRDALLKLQDGIGQRQVRVAIYGAGAAGAQLAASLRLSGGHNIITFIDDAPHLWSRTINAIAIHSPEHLIGLCNEVDQILLAIPSLSRRRRREIVDQLQALGLTVLQVPSVEEITSGRALITALRPIAIEELLGRDAVAPDPELLGPGIREAVVCVTGAGGSIGSELCRQILRLAPQQLILLEQSEPSLYAIDQELRAIRGASTCLLPVLGNAADQTLLQLLFAERGVQVVFHAAAYKHVPLVEVNPLAGLANNVLSTKAVCQVAASTGVKRVILVSTDKAVRPTNVMGATKRLAELVVQASAIDFSGQTCFAMVRFGNVLGSSGSVVPLFRRQIAAGGPITVTHPEIIRYFMTIPEAAQLVLQAEQMAQGGDVFLLDMGEPVRIKDLAEQMVHLSGLTLRDTKCPNGDIEIVYTGLRPGEKLFEELLIDAKSIPTSHSLIYRAREKSILPSILWPRINALENAVRMHDEEAALALLSELVPEWHRADKSAVL